MIIGSSEREAILRALPPPARSPRLHGGVASLITAIDGRVLDAGVILADDPEVFLRPLPTDDPDALAFWLSLLERRRLQLVHDVSGPATGVLAAIETVLEYEPIPETTRSILRDARGGMVRMTHVLEDRGGQLSGPVNAVSGRMPRLLAHWAAASREMVDPGELIQLRVDAPDVEVRVDASVCTGALFVLMGNAWKNRRGHTVRLSVEARVEDGWLEIAVCDEGRGMDEATLRRSGELGFTTRPSALGLGLFLLRWTLRESGGAVVVMRREPGAMASVFLPANI
jgi:signal transduction histidine kinase